MFANYFKIAFRNLLKFKSYTSINLAGLSLGLAAGIIILLYVIDQLSFDSFQVNKDRVYRVETLFRKAKNGGNEGAMETNGWPVGDILRKNFPEVEAVLYASRASNLLVNSDDKRFEERSFYMSPEFFTIFSFPLLKGNPATALTAPYSVVISEKLEKKYFHGEDALNKSLTMADNLHFVVTGVMKDMPSNSSIQADILVSFSTYSVINPQFNYDDGWGNINKMNYVMLKKNADARNFFEKAKPVYMQHAGKMMDSWGVTADLKFLSLNDLYLRNDVGNILGTVGSIKRIWLVSAIAFFVILLACINFVNLATARSVHRAKEVGLRKVVGSTRYALMLQFLSESFLLTALSFVIALALIGVGLPLFNQLLGKSYGLGSFIHLPLIAAIAALIIMIAFLAGYYPALVLSAMKPVSVMKGKVLTSDKGIQLRRALVIFQFIISITLVAGTFIVIGQLDYMQKQALGFSKDEILVVNAMRANSKDPNAFTSLASQMNAESHVQQAALANAVPGHQGWPGQVAYPEGHDGENAVSTEYVAADENYIPTLGLTLMAGRNFDISRPLDKSEGLIINETAVTKMGWSSAANAIGKKITSPSGYPAGEVIGVVKNYHQTGLQEAIGPIVIDYNPEYGSMFAVRYHAAETRNVIDRLETLWKKSFPGYDFNYYFLNQDFEKQYHAEQRLGNVFTLFSGITILIAVIGLFGLVSFMTVSRTKEIGVRKVLGATPLSITQLLSKEFIVLVLLANIAALPLAWLFASKWLQGFAYRMELTPWLFITTGVVAMLITLMAVSYQTIKASMINPVKSLRYE